MDRDAGSGNLLDNVPELCHCPTTGKRFGEAEHPGPVPEQDSLLTVGVGNPGGLRAKEDLVLSLGPGIWTMSETQLSAVTTSSAAKAFRNGGQKLHRRVRPHFSHPAPLRHGSQWAGKWTGVCTTSDWPSSQLTLPWPPEHWSTGRLLLTRHWVQQCPITMGGFYGFAQGPTWPKAKQHSDQLLETFTREVVLGMDGIRMLVGDYNFEPEELTQQKIWKRHGWTNAQTLAAEIFHHEWTPTCKNVNERDQIWLSPEAAQLFRGVQFHEIFSDHLVMAIKLYMPCHSQHIFKWPRPKEIPWNDFEHDTWSPTCAIQPQDFEDTTAFMQSWANEYEEAISMQHQQQLGKPLHMKYRGRAQRLEPARQTLAPVTCKPSREGEVCLQHSLVGKAVRNWYKQLRRLQSLCHAVLANKQTPAAVQYRASLWTAIVQAKGFHPSFAEWWEKRETPCDGAPAKWPDVLPADALLIQTLYKDFLFHFRAFESWHLAERTASLKTKYEGSLSSMFNDLRDEPKASIDHVWKEIQYQILAVDYATQQVMLDREIATKHDSIWFLDGSQIKVSQIDGVVCTVSSIENFEVEGIFVQRLFLTEIHEVLDSFTQHWLPRWNLLSQLNAEVWDRVVKFTQAHMPRFSFSLPPLDVEIWQKTVRQFKPRAARGPDGFAKNDLLFMPHSFSWPLLHMLQQIEQTDMPWPAQLLFGTVIGTAKRKDAHEESHFRPITLFSILFRCWSRLRTKQMISQMANFMPAEALGFLPHREATEIWLQLQWQIELMLTLDEPFCGMSSDVKRAFNHIGRKQVFHMSRHLGFPEELLNPWDKFLSAFVRRFDIRGCVGPIMTSDSGYPEGDPLSILAMLTVNWGYHIYMKIFVPKVQAYSFVDNLTLAAREAQQVIQGYFAMLAYNELFGLSLDDEKTYVWGLTTVLRKTLAQLGFPCMYDASELGASLSYGAKIRNRHLKARGTGMDEKWQKLRRSAAPTLQKFAMLPKVFWPKALHGSPACVIADAYLLALRRAATKALRVNGAGANPMLRLSFSDEMQNDPGFYQIMYTFATLRRIARKSTDLVPMWQVWYKCYEGRQLPGPFTKIQQCLSQLGWRILDPPFVCDHAQRAWNLITVDMKTFRTLMTDAWSQFVASQTRHKTMKDLNGIEYSLVRLASKGITPTERALVAALQSGAFVSASEHARYDVEKLHICPLCQHEDDRAHWLVCPRFQSLRQSIPNWYPDNVMLPMSLTHHLLAPKLKEMTEWHNTLHDLQDCTTQFLFYPPDKEFQHLFTDGACTQLDHSCLSLASWGVLSATSGEPVCLGHLRGITQSIDRAELTAIVAAVHWTTEHDICVWSDSKSNVDTAEQISLHGCIPPQVENYDLWLQLQEALELRQGRRTEFRWVPSHIHVTLAEDPFEEWLFRWNNSVDVLVTNWNHRRDAKLLQQQAALLGKLQWWEERIFQLRTFYFKVAEQQAKPDDQSLPHEVVLEQIEIESDDENMQPADLIADLLPLTWQVKCRQSNGKVPGCFTESILQWFCAAEQLENQPIVVSDLDLVFVFSCDSDFLFPFQLDGSTSWQMRRLADLFQRPTVGMLLRPIQSAMQHLAQLFPEAIVQTPSKPAKEYGVYKQFRGIRAFLPGTIVEQARERLVRFTTGRAVRKTADLARPMT